MSGSNYLHFNAIRVRVNGTGNLVPIFYGFDDILSYDLVALEMALTDKQSKFRLANFTSQAGRLKLGTVESGEQFRINDITIFVTPVWSEMP